MQNDSVIAARHETIRAEYKALRKQPVSELRAKLRSQYRVFGSAADLDKGGVIAMILGNRHGSKHVEKALA